MVAGYHLIWTVYGFWLPNDPRGSTSKDVRVEPVKDIGAHHYGRKEKQPSSKELRAFLANAHDVLTHSVRPLSDGDIKKIITDGKGKMKAVKTVSGGDADNVVAYIRTLKK